MGSKHREHPNFPKWNANLDPASIIIPGLDISVSVYDQIEQIEQLITFKLQNVDENFSRIQHLLSTRLLPSIKRFGAGIVPVRVASKFWTSFYESAADICIPTADMQSTLTVVPTSLDGLVLTATDWNQDHQSLTPLEATQSRSQYQSNISAEANLFFSGQAAFSSTPATDRVTKIRNGIQAQYCNESWVSSLESRLNRLDRDIQHYSQETGDGGSEVDDKRNYHSYENVEEADVPRLRKVLFENIRSAKAGSSEYTSSTLSPIKFRRKPNSPSTLKKYNPYLPVGANAANWNGLVDLGVPANFTPRPLQISRDSRTPYAYGKKSEDESFDGLPPGMSPPVLVSPARPPRSSAELDLLLVGKTPNADIPARIKRDLLRDFHPFQGIESSMSTMPTPPSLSRYNRSGDTSGSIIMNSSLESMIRRVGIKISPFSKISNDTKYFTDLPFQTTEALRLRSQDAQSAIILPSLTSNVSKDTTEFLSDSQEEFGVDSDSLDEINNTKHPSDAFLMASSRVGNTDDSLISDESNDSLIGDGGVRISLSPDILNNAYDEDSSYDDLYDGAPSEEETLFGVPPAQRLRAQAERLEIVRE